MNHKKLLISINRKFYKIQNLLFIKIAIKYNQLNNSNLKDQMIHLYKDYTLTKASKEVIKKKNRNIKKMSYMFKLIQNQAIYYKILAKNRISLRRNNQ